ncbi:LL-diaminopimelate aminotransferase [Fredinandcohnia sp. QZ13]|uniref:LL-diaminopimelate aminotransferase n=1 Tax=Fredinandcohnia sp. QZ13 TaxID=3073144 RepID=UPI002852F918|nr:LL-diaminopimelate aminotransferase [Fredinandcohnia sp. QZ13]MDR4886783.1 LL-diaminopimelate aminotransferase [Fredinandcohnia sp. QZ13]
MKITLSQKMNEFGESVFTELANYKKNKMREGQDIIDLSVGSPDLPPPPYVIEALATHVQNPSLYGYSLTGIDELHDAISNYYIRRYDVPVNKESEVLMVMGSQDGLVHFPMAFANPGDLVLVPDPGYTAYAAGIALAGAKPYGMPLKEENQFLPDLDAIPEDICQKAKIMILNFPGNPVPALATQSFFEKVIQFAKKHQILVLHDFAYSELYFEEKPISFLSVEGAKEVGVEFNSLSKSFNMAGCRIGYMVGNPDIIAAINRLKSNLDYGVFLPIQKAAIAALRDTSNFSENLRETYKKRRDLLVNGLADVGWQVESPKASMFIWAKIPKGFTSTEFTYRLIDEAGIVVTPGNAFGPNGEGYVRIGLVQNEETLKKGVQRLQDIPLLK